MQVICYHRKQRNDDTGILDRAMHKKHQLKKLVLWDILLFVVVGILGPVLHFASPTVSPIPLLHFIAPINESIWEHLKLLYYPAVLVALVRRLMTGKLQHGILTTFAEGILLSMLLIIILFYTYSGIIGNIYLWADVLIFYFSDLVLTLYVHIRSSRQKKSSLPGLLILLLLAGCFFYFSLYPLNIGLFQELSQPLR